MQGKERTWKLVQEHATTMWLLRRTLQTTGQKVTVVRNHLLCRRTTYTHSRNKEPRDYRSWYMIKNDTRTTRGMIELNKVIFPKELIGRKVRFIVEIIPKELNEGFKE